ncbi:MAG: hypothetical protein ACFCU1_08415 [Sumerlaeia bacterium]
MLIKKYAFILAVITPVLLTGCGVIYSQQDYGTPHYHQIVEGATKTEVFANLGSPNSIYHSKFRENEKREVFVYTYAKGKNFLGVYSKIERRDTIVVFNGEDEVIYVGEVTVGKGNTILSGPFTDSTHPVRTDTLLFEPSNFGYNIEEVE